MTGGKRFCGLVGCWALLAAFAVPPGSRLPYDLSGMVDPAPAASARAAAGPRPLNYDTAGLFEAPAAAAAPLAASSPRRPQTPSPIQASLTIDMAVLADSNFNNATDLPVVLVDYGNGPVPVPLDAESRRRSGVGWAIGGAGSADLRLGDGAVIAADLEAFLIDHEGGANDDASLLFAAGPELGLPGGGHASLQLLAFQRWYGGISASAGTGMRGAVVLPVARGANLRLLAEGRWFQSDYSDDFDGSLGSLSLFYDAVLGPSLSGTAGVYVRRYWLESASFSNAEAGFYGALSAYLGPHLTGGLSAGISRAAFDAPIAWFSADPRRDWRVYGSLSVRARRPIFDLLQPSLMYTYGRTYSSVRYYDAERHVLRLGLGASF